jgi:hypothetical protein
MNAFKTLFLGVLVTLSTYATTTPAVAAALK